MRRNIFRLVPIVVMIFLMGCSSVSVVNTGTDEVIESTSASSRDISVSESDNDIEEIDTSDNPDEKEEKTNTETLLYEMIGEYSYDNILKDGTSGKLEIAVEDGIITITDYCNDWSDYRFELSEEDIVKENEYAVYLKCEKENSEDEEYDCLIIEKVEFGIDVYYCNDEYDEMVLLYNAQ